MMINAKRPTVHVALHFREATLYSKCCKILGAGWKTLH